MNTRSKISPYVYGTTRLGDDNIEFEKRVEFAILAMKQGIWFHTSDMYGDALNVLGEAFKREPNNIPKLIIKIGYDSFEQVKETIEKNLTPLGLESFEMGQLCFQKELADEFANGGKCYKQLEELKSSGVVKRFVYEVFPWTSEAPYTALKNGVSDEILEGHIFYFNPIQRFAANKLWKLIKEKSAPFMALRTVSGGPVHMLRDVPGFAWKEYIQKRAVEIAPIFEESGVKSWTEFCIRFAFSYNNLLATVGSTANSNNLNEFLLHSKDIKPLPNEIISKIESLQDRWSDELDIHAEPWTM